jgi:hypothetical protein
VASAPRIDSRLIAAMQRFDDRGRPIAETYRRIGLIAETIGLSRPSYEQVRRLIHEQRAGRRDPGIGSVLLDIAFRAAPPEALLEVLAGTGPPPRRTK